MANIIITFPNNQKTYELPLSTLELYPNCPFHGYLALSENNQIELPDLTILEFDKMYDVLIGDILQHEATDDTKALLHHYGLSCDTLHEAEQYWKKVYQIKMNRQLYILNLLLKSQNEFIRIKEVHAYTKYSDMFKSNKNMIPVQIIWGTSYITHISILEGLPIYIGDIPGKPIYQLQNAGQINISKQRNIVFKALRIDSKNGPQYDLRNINGVKYCAALVSAIQYNFRVDRHDYSMQENHETSTIDSVSKVASIINIAKKYATDTGPHEFDMNDKLLFGFIKLNLA